MTAAVALAAAAGTLAVAMAVAWLVAERTGRSGWIDTIWSLSTGVVACGLALVPLDGGTAGRR